MDDLISRQIIKAQMMKYGFRAPDMTVTEFVEDCLPSAQQDCSDCIKHGGDWDCDHVHCHKGESAQPGFNEWCTDCKEYDQERHCCPRFNRVIRETLDEVKEQQQQQQYEKKGKWILDKNGQFRCSNCEQVPVNRIIINAFLVYDVPTIKEHMKYCPMCGARME